MIKEEKNIDFYTTGRQPTNLEFEQIRKWIKRDKEKKRLTKSRSSRGRYTSRTKKTVSILKSTS